MRTHAPTAHTVHTHTHTPSVWLLFYPGEGLLARALDQETGGRKSALDPPFLAICYWMNHLPSLGLVLKGLD